VERSPRCSRHPGAAAGWSCRACDAQLCPGCAFPLPGGTTTLVCCARCGGLAEVLTAHRAALRSFAARLGPALLAPFRRASLLTLVATAVAMWVLGFIPLGGILAQGVFWGLLFSVIRQGSRGVAAMETPDFGELT
jgi:hypothetical protein